MDWNLSLTFMFGVYFNSILTFWTLALLVETSIWLLRLRDTRAAWLLRLLPVIKLPLDLLLLYDFSSWSLSLGLDPLQGGAESRQLVLAVGAGLSALFIPWFRLAAFLRFEDSNFSAADLVAIWIGPFLRTVLLAVFVLGSVVFLVRLLRQMLDTWTYTRSLQLELVASRKFSFFRTAHIYLSPDAACPFACGIFSCKVVLPKQLASRISHSQFEAIVQHEIEHLKYFDSIADGLLRLIAAFYWCLPGLSIWMRRLQHNKEMACDLAARRKGACGLALAEALQHCLHLAKSSAHLQKFPSAGALLVQRIQTCLQPTKRRLPTLIAAPLGFSVASCLIYGQFWTF